ncbi:MAG: hypothetical protein O9972_52175, partial [Burkholderiales bacterium]|nr:hypothetical protein [Burkholderiales bacterium]
MIRAPFAPTLASALLAASALLSPCAADAADAPKLAAAAQASGAWIRTIVDDMKLFHDAPCAVLDALPGWGSGASWPEATPRPSGWQYAIPWTHV